MAAIIPSASLLLLAWTLGGVLAITGGLTYAEMGAMFPRSGGVYVFLREAYGPLPAFLYGWAALLVVFSGGIAAVAVGFAEYLSYFVPALSHAGVALERACPFGPLTISAGQLVAAAAIAVARRDQLRRRSQRQPRQRRPHGREGRRAGGAADPGDRRCASAAGLHADRAAGSRRGRWRRSASR